MNNKELDIVILKHILNNKKNALEFLHESSEKVFVPDLWRFAKTVLDYIKTYKELPTRKVINEKNQKNESLISYINKIWDDIDQVSVDEREYKHDMEKIKNRFTENLIFNLRENLVDGNGRVDIKKSISEITSTVNHIKSINQVKAFDQKSLKESIKEFRDSYVARQTNKNYMRGFKTGYSFLDQAIGSIYETELFIVAAESGVGKSLMLMNMGINMWLGENNFDTEKDFAAGADILYFSLEMPFEAMQQRCLASMAKVPQTSIRDACLTEDETKSVAKVIKFIERYPHDFTIVDIPRGATINTIETVYNEICATKKRPQIVIVDYLALLSHDQKDLSDWLQLNYLSEALHEFGRVHNVVTLTASQLNKPNQNKGAGDQNSLHRLSRSSLIAANANFVMIIEKRPNENQLPNMQLHLIKSRRSALVSGTIYKELESCSLLDKPSVDDLFFNNGDEDISGDIE